MTLYIRCAVVCLASLGLMLSSGFMAGQQDAPSTIASAEPLAAASAALGDTALSDLAVLKARSN
ncbi:hypothetical protein [Uliginosibacterium sp. TH139]|uniref:hypothetical protein n=1 Tax=Uliginosibacterium sp. TH139 TaxID=2067453 RepID=UPI000C7B38D5|nr:hypothetical protein [Uliginosibacterium sp. TH139]PLK50063.1 hypothetical protein C0V76_06560 [Uliginosibacterium sp. TH139]